MITQGTVVTIRPEYQDEDDGSFIWVASDDEANGRVTLQTRVTETLIKTEVFQVFMLETVNP